MSDIKFPFGAAATETISGTGTKTATIVDNFTIIDLTVTGAVTLNLTLSELLNTGAIVVTKVTQDATGRNVTMGTGYSATVPDLTGVASDTDLIVCFYDGTYLVPFTAAWQKIVDAA